MIRLLPFLIFLCSTLLAFSQKDMGDICPLKVGSEIPDVSIVDENNASHTISDLTADTPAVIIFYRGAWCGYCTQHLAELNDIKADIESLGFQVFGVTLDQPSKISESHKKAESEISVYSDSSAAAVSAFGLDWKVSDETFDKYKNEYKLDLEAWSGQDHHTLPVPAIYVVRDGVVQFQYVNPNYNTRLNPETLLAVLKTI